MSVQASYGGEDAFFISQQGSTAFGVADGVGGWVTSGINPAGEEFEHTLVVMAAELQGLHLTCTIASPVFSRMHKFAAAF